MCSITRLIRDVKPSSPSGLCNAKTWSDLNHCDEPTGSSQVHRTAPLDALKSYLYSLKILNTFDVLNQMRTTESLLSSFIVLPKISFLIDTSVSFARVSAMSLGNIPDVSL